MFVSSTAVSSADMKSNCCNGRTVFKCVTLSQLHCGEGDALILQALGCGAADMRATAAINDYIVPHEHRHLQPNMAL